MIRFGDLTYQIKGLLGDRNRSGQWGLTHSPTPYLYNSFFYLLTEFKRRPAAPGYKIRDSCCTTWLVRKSLRKNWKTLVCTVTLSSAIGGLMKSQRPTEATFLSVLFKRLASASGRRQGHKVSSVGSLSQEKKVRTKWRAPLEIG